MKVFRVENDICYWDATKQFPTKNSTIGYFPESVLFVEAPDYVFEGWGYVDGEFIKLSAPDGWIYDENTGTFYPEGYEPEEPDTVASSQTFTKLLNALIA